MRTIPQKDRRKRCTGTFACQLAERGVDVIGVDPAAASLDVARAKPGAGNVRWIHGDGGTAVVELDPGSVDLAVMTGNVAQVFVTDDDWLANLAGLSRVVRPGGRLVFETRDPAKRAWEEWTSTSVLRFRTRHDLDASLASTGFDVSEVRGAPDRLGKEFVYVAQRRG